MVTFSGILFCDYGEPPVDALINIKVTGTNNPHNFEFDETTDDDGFYLGTHELPFGKKRGIVVRFASELDEFNRILLN